MPYITIDQQQEVLSAMTEGSPAFETVTVGQLNFVITKALVAWLGEEPHYVDFNSAIGVLECAKLELYRRMVAPYEDAKCVENGDVY